MWTHEEERPREEKQLMEGEGVARRSEGRQATEREQVRWGFVGHIGTQGYSEQNEKSGF